MTMRNPILDADSYKVSHFKQYPPGTTEVSAYIEARAGGDFDAVTFFGLQMFLKEKLAQRVTPSNVYEAEALVTAHLPGVPFNREGWDTIVNGFGGVLPIELSALPEGMTVPVGTPLVQVRNTDPRFAWLTTYVETAMLRGVWYPSTVATQSREAKKVIYAGLIRSSDDPDGQIPFKLHDFGARGCTSAEQAGLGGAAHLVGGGEGFVPVNVVGDDVHAEGAGADGDLLADAAKADDADGFLEEFVAGLALPAAGAGGVGVEEEVFLEREQEEEGVLGDGGVVDARGEKEREAELGAGADVELVHAEAQFGNDAEAGAVLYEDAARDGVVAADVAVDVADEGERVGFVERTAGADDFPAGGGEEVVMRAGRVLEGGGGEEDAGHGGEMTDDG